MTHLWSWWCFLILPLLLFQVSACSWVLGCSFHLNWYLLIPRSKVSRINLCMNCIVYKKMRWLAALLRDNTSLNIWDDYPCKWSMNFALKPSVLCSLVRTKIRNLGYKPCSSFIPYKQKLPHPFMSLWVSTSARPCQKPSLGIVARAWCTTVTWQQT